MYLLSFATRCFVILVRVMILTITLPYTALSSISRTRRVLRSSDSRQLAHLYYRVEALNAESATMKEERAELLAALEIEKLGFEESKKLQNAVMAAKRGATSVELKENYDLQDAEAELIASVHGSDWKIRNRVVH